MVIVAAPPSAEAAAARPAAAQKPKTRRRSPNPNAGPNQRSSSQATRIASPALQKPLSIEVIRLLSPKRLAAAVPITTPTTSAEYARRPDTIRKPAAMPDAGQNTATSEGCASNKSPSWAVRK